MAKQTANQRAPSTAAATNSPSRCAGLRGRVQFVRGGARSALGLSKVYLSPQDMGTYRIDAGVHVAVFAASDQVEGLQQQQEELILCGVAWPMDKIKRHGVGLSSMWEEHLAAKQQQHSNSSAEFVQVLALQQVRATVVSRKEAKSVTLQVVSRASKIPSDKEKALLVRYVGTMLDGVLLHSHALLSLPVHGVNTVFSVAKISQEEDRGDPAMNVVFRISGQTNLAINWVKPVEPAEEVGSVESSLQAKSDVSGSAGSPQLRGFASVGGLKAEIETIRQIIEQPLVNPDMFKKFGLPPPKGLLMFGPPGTGKTLIARALAAELKAKIFFINGPEVVSKYIGESESNLRKIFQNAARMGPSLIFIDEIDAICPKRDGRVGDMEKRMVATLLTLMDGLEKNAQVVVLAATNRPNALDPAIRRPGRFDREVEISIPNAKDRLDILRVTLARLPHSVTDDQLQELSSSAHGYVGADLSALCKEAALVALQRSFALRQKQQRLSSGSADASEDTKALANPLHPSTQLPSFMVEVADLKHAMSGIRPSALREIAIDVPRVLWNDIGGQHMIKQQLKEAVEWPLKHPEAFIRMGIRPPKGVLLYGPPGCSKTLTAKALATESSMNFIAIKGPELFSKWVGESEKAVQSIFRKARAAAPTVVFFDEIDAIASQRGGGDGGGSQVADRVLSQLLTELDGIEPLKQVLVVAATNRPDLIDSALMRPGRIDRVLYVGPPDLQARQEILSIHCRKIPLDADVNLQEIAIATAQFSGAELYSLCREAAMAAIEESKTAEAVSIRHFLRALKMIQPQIDASMLAFFENFRLGRMKSKDHQLEIAFLHRNTCGHSMRVFAARCCEWRRDHEAAEKKKEKPKTTLPFRCDQQQHESRVSSGSKKTRDDDDDGRLGPFLLTAWRALMHSSSSKTAAADLATGRKILEKIQAALAQAFRKRGAYALSVEEIAPIKALCDQLLPAHFQLNVPDADAGKATGASRWKARHVRYQHIWEDDKFSMGIFILPPGASIPLHDHPEMSVISRVLYGNLHVKSCDIVPLKDAVALIDQHFPSTGAPTPAALPRIARMYTNQVIAAPYTTELLPDRGNLHEFVAGDAIGCAIFDILTPPYEPDEGRDCTYYRFVGPAKQDEASGEELVVLEEFDPVNFEVHTEPYKGPALTQSVSTASSSSSVLSGGSSSSSSLLTP